MADKTRKITIQIGASLKTDEVQAVAKKMQDLISASGSSETAKKQAANYLKEMENAQKKINEIQAKGKIDVKDLASLNSYFSTLESNYQKLNSIISEMVSIPTEEIVNLQKKIGGLKTEIEKTTGALKDKFTGATTEILGKTISFENVDKEINKLNGAIEQSQLNIEDIGQKSYDSTLERLQAEQTLRINSNKKIASDLQKQIKDFKNANGEKYKSYRDFIDDYNSLSKELGDLRTTFGSVEKRKKIVSSGEMTQEEVDANYQLLLSLKEQKAAREEVIKSIAKGSAKIQESQKNNLTSEQMVKLATEASIQAKKKEELEIDALTNKRDLLIKKYEETKIKIDTETKDTKELIEVMEDEIFTIEDIIDAKLKAQKEEATTGASKVVEDIKSNKEVLGNYNIELSKAQAVQKAVGTGLSEMGARFKSAMGAVYLFNQALRQIKQAALTVTNLDNEITQIAVVTKQTTEEVWDSFETFNKAAAQLSTTTRQYLEGAKIFYQQGMNTAQVMQMVEATTKAAALSGVTFRDASETLTAAINAYNMEATQAMDVTDKFAAVGAASAADFNELSVAMKKVASQAYSSGMSFDSLLGILAKGIETTRKILRPYTVMCIE